MENNNLTIYNPNNDERNDTKEENTDTTESYPDRDQSDIDHSQNNIQNDSSDNNDSTESIDVLKNRIDEQPLSPSQALCLMTTVPQNFAARTLGDKHTPTRNSLRHSRMIVMNRHGKIPKKYLPYIIRHSKLVKAAKVIMIVLGVLLCLLSILMVLWSPTLTAVDFPYWSAVPVLFSGVVGCFFLGFCPRPYPGRRLGCFYYLVKFVSLLTAAMCIMATIVVLSIAVSHLAYLFTASCDPHDTLNITCVCKLNSSTPLYNESYHYEDLTCGELDYFLKPMVFVVAFFNLLALLLDVFYVCVHWVSNRTYVYAKVPLRQGVRTDDS